MKIHCAQLVEGALRSALEPEKAAIESQKEATKQSTGPTLLDSFTKPKEGGIKITFLEGSK